MHKKPTRRDLLVIVGRLQDLVGEARMHYENDQDDAGLGKGRDAIERAAALCIRARSFDPVVVDRGPWATNKQGEET